MRFPSGQIYFFLLVDLLVDSLAESFIVIMGCPGEGRAWFLPPASLWDAHNWFARYTVSLFAPQLYVHVDLLSQVHSLELFILPGFNIQP